MSRFVLFSKLSPRISLKYVRHQHISASKLFLDEFGDPAKVVKKEDFTLDVPEMRTSQVI